MGSYLICVFPAGGHVAPVLQVAKYLVDRGDRVRMLTGSRFADAVTATGAEFVSLPPEADFDDTNLDVAFPERQQLRGIAALRYDILHIFIKPMPFQYRTVQQLLDSEPVDAIVGEYAFTGLTPLLAGPDRPPIVALGVLPLTLSSRDTAPYGLALPPSASVAGRVRNRLLNAVVRRVVLAPVQREANRLLTELGRRSLKIFALDYYRLVDHVVHLGVADFEYPRSDLPPNVTFAGPVRSAAKDFPKPTWWDDLDSGRPVVHVTQGTLDNADLGKVIEPTIVALADSDVLVVVATGGRPADTVSIPVPPNVRVAEMLPYADLLAKTDVMVTNGGYGGVLLALAHGVPLVVAGAAEDKPEVAARVAWSGTGINLKTGRPSPPQVAAAVGRILADSRYRENAERIADAIGRTDALATVGRELDRISGATTR